MPAAGALACFRPSDSCACCVGRAECDTVKQAVAAALKLSPLLRLLPSLKAHPALRSASPLHGILPVNLAVALAQRLGLRVGLLDADVYGPSCHRMMRVAGKPRVDEGEPLPPRRQWVQRLRI